MLEIETSMPRHTLLHHYIAWRIFLQTLLRVPWARSVASGDIGLEARMEDEQDTPDLEGRRLVEALFGMKLLSPSGLPRAKWVPCAGRRNSSTLPPKPCGLVRHTPRWPATQPRHTSSEQGGGPVKL